MLALIQRVTHASVTINQIVYSQIDEGLLILCGFESEDTWDDAEKLLTKCFNYRVFSDENDKMNLCLQNIEGQALIVPQFTLVADTKRGLRPSFSRGMSPGEGNQLFNEVVAKTPNIYHRVSFGSFGADMKINLCNDGPVTFMLSSH